MSDIEREPCPRCGEPAALSAQVCPHCRGNLLVDIVLDVSPADPRALYQAARTISALGPPAPAFLAAQQSLNLPGSVLASGATREMARKMTAAIAENGGRARTSAYNPPSAAPPPSGSPWMKLLAASLAVAAVGLFSWSRFISSSDVEIPLRPAEPHAAGPALTTRELAEQATPSTVKLRCQGSVGSGFFIAEDLVLTNAHVLCPAGERIRAVLSDGREIEGVEDRRDDWLDIALVRVPGAKARPLPRGDALDLHTGDRVVFIGTPEGLDFTVHEGIVSHSIRSVMGVGYLQIDANVNSGNSGGPLFDPQGRVVGIVTAKVTGADGLGFALPINYVSEGSPPFLPLPSPAASSDNWNAVLAKIREADRREVEKLRAEGNRPALVGLTVMPRGGPVAMIVRFSNVRPQPETLSFTFRKSNRILCNVSGGVRQWYAQGSGNVAASDDSHYLRWLEKNGLVRQAYHGLATLDLTGCPVQELRDAEMVLDGGDERANRIEL